MKQQSILCGRSGHAITGARPKNKKHDIALQPRGGAQSDYSLVAPIRQTASIFKQPVTIYKEHKSKVKSDLKHVSREKPLQVFWTKRLSSLTLAACRKGETFLCRSNYALLDLASLTTCSWRASPPTSTSPRTPPWGSRPACP
eukprot:TRINITY_DN10818_c0_g1_i5.p1 TRINITY_DN10818_c0_g1~~TRINITY_DN10818_c0_g1_i5.p1  ORF type:complete len:143 (-),score=33.82 TRINITY_DN10818_c0_g1_i5:255-683(-)